MNPSGNTVMKKCNTCLAEKPLVDFPKDKSKKDGRHGKCRICNAADCARRYLLNKDKWRAGKQKWEAANREKLRIDKKAWRDANLEKARASERAYYARNKEFRLAKTKQWNEANVDRVKTVTAAWAKANPGRKNRSAAIRKAAKLQRTPSWLTQADIATIEQLYLTAAALSDFMGEPYEVDHIIPLQGELVSGLHVPDNLQILPKSANRSKRNKFTPG